MKTFRDLMVWQKSMAMVTAVYQSTVSFSRAEQFGLTAQIRRTAVSIPSNIAEGYGRKSTKDYVRFLQIAMGSLYELQTQLEILGNLTFLDSDTFEGLHEKAWEIERMTSSLIFKIEKS